MRCNKTLIESVHLFKTPKVKAHTNVQQALTISLDLLMDFFTVPLKKKKENASVTGKLCRIVRLRKLIDLHRVKSVFIGLFWE